MRKILFCCMIFTLIISFSISFANSDKDIIGLYTIKKPYYSQKYYKYEDADFTGFQARVRYDDNTVETINWDDDRIVFEGFDSSNPGKQVISVYYRDKGINRLIHTFLITVLDEKKPVLRGAKNRGPEIIESIELIKGPDKSVYRLSETIELDGMKFLVYYTDGTKEIVSIPNDNFEIDSPGYDMDHVGAQNINIDVSYKGFFKSFEFRVIYKDYYTEKVITNILAIKYPPKWEKGSSSVDIYESMFQIEFSDGSTEEIYYDDVYLGYYVYGNAVIVYSKSCEDVYCIIIREDIIDNYYSFNKNICWYEKDLFFQCVYELTIDLPNKYDLRDTIDIPVEYQGPDGLCWDFAATKSLETNLLLRHDADLDLSERYADYISSSLYYGKFEQGGGGNFPRYSDFMEKTGVPLEENVPYESSDTSIYDNLENVDKAASLESVIKFPDTITIEANKSKLKEYLKKHIIINGSIATSLLYSDVMYDPDYRYYYYENGLDYIGGHEVSIIGWDDTIPKEYFAKEDDYGNVVCPKNDGGWLALNSWSDSWGDDGCFYISYDSEEMIMFGVLGSNLYEKMNQYSYTENKPYIEPVKNNTVDTHRYFYVTFDKSSNTELLSHLILHLDRISNIYLLDDCENVDFSKKQFLFTYEDTFYMTGNCRLEEPIELKGDKFMIIIEMLDCDVIKADISYQPVSDGNVHTYYTDDEMSTEWTPYDGDIYLNVYTIDAKKDYMLGDLDEDDKITINDVRILLQAYINTSVWTPEDLALKDINGDGVVNTYDIRMLLQMYINQ